MDSQKYIASLLCSTLFILVGTTQLHAEDVKLPEVTVTAQAEQQVEDKLMLSPGTVTVIRPEDSTGEQKNLPDLLKQVPGLHIIETKGRGSYTTASIRGSSSSQVAVYVDGVLQNLGSESAVDISAIPVNNVAQIEVYRGYIPAKFGGASMGGVINIITKEPEITGGSVTLSDDTYSKRRAGIIINTPLTHGKLSAAANIEDNKGDFKYRNDNNTPYTLQDDYDTHRQNNHDKNSDILLKYGGDKLSLQGSWKKNDRDLPYSAPGEDKASSMSGANLDTEQYNAIATYSDAFNNLEYNIRMEYLNQVKKYSDPFDKIGGWGQQHNKYTTRRFGGEVNGSLPLGENHYIEFLLNKYDERLTTDGDIINHLGGDKKHSRTFWNAQIQDTITLNEDGTIWFTPVIRWNNSDDKTDFSYGGAITGQIGTHWTAKVTGGTYNRAPNLYERYGDGAFIISNPNLKWEEGTQYDAGISWNGSIRNAAVTAELTYFYRKSENLIDYVMANPRYARYINIGKTEVNGVEFEAIVKYNKWDMYVNATWMDPKNKTEGYLYDTTLPNRPKWEGTVRISRKILKEDRATLFGEVHHTGENYYDMLDEIGWDNLTTVNGGIKYDLNNDLKIVAGVNDIFNKAPDVQLFATQAGPSRMLWYPMQGRTIYATVIWSF